MLHVARFLGWHLSDHHRRRPKPLRRRCRPSSRGPWTHRKTHPGRPDGREGREYPYNPPMGSAVGGQLESCLCTERDSLGAQPPDEFAEARFVNKAIAIRVFPEDQANLLAWMQRDQGDLCPIGVPLTLEE